MDTRNRLRVWMYVLLASSHVACERSSACVDTRNRLRMCWYTAAWGKTPAAVGGSVVVEVCPGRGCDYLIMVEREEREVSRWILLPRIQRTTPWRRAKRRSENPMSVADQSHDEIEDGMATQRPMVAPGSPPRPCFFCSFLSCRCLTPVRASLRCFMPARAT